MGSSGVTTGVAISAGLAVSSVRTRTVVRFEILVVFVQPRIVGPHFVSPNGGVGEGSDTNVILRGRKCDIYY